MRAKWWIAAMLWAEPLASPPTHFELRFRKNAVEIRTGDVRTRWFRERAGLEVRSVELSSGRRIYWLPALKVADVGAAPRREAREISALAAREGWRTLIWRKRDPRDWGFWDRALPAQVTTVIATGEMKSPERELRRRLWINARTPARFRY